MTGTITADGKPVAGALVISTHANPGVLSFLSGWTTELACPPTGPRLTSALENHEREASVVGRTFTDENGQFEVRIGGNAAIWVDAPPWAARYVFIGPPGEVNRLDLALTRGVMAIGRIVDEARAPVAQATVTVVHPDGRYFDALTSDAGTFALGPFEVDRPAVFVRRAGYQTEYVPLQPGPDGVRTATLRPPRGLTFTVRNDDGPVARIPVEVGRPPCTRNVFSDSDGGVEVPDLTPGEYTVKAGSPTVGAHRTVVLRPEDRRRTLAPLLMQRWGALNVDLGWPPADPGAVAVTAYCGGGAVPLKEASRTRFTGIQLPPGDCLVEVQGPSTLSQWVTLAAETFATARFSSFAPRIVMQPVRVNDRQGRVPDARVYFENPDGGAGGAVSLAGDDAIPLTEGVWDLWAAGSGKVSQRTRVRVPALGPLALKLEAAPVIRGKVVDAAGARVARVAVQVRCAGDDLAGEDTTNAQGEFELRPERTGPCVLVARLARDGLIAERVQPVALAVNGKLNLTVALPPLAPMPDAGVDAGAPAPVARDAGTGSRPASGPEWVAGVRVLDADGGAIPHAFLDVASPGAVPCLHGGSAVTDTNGRGWIELGSGQQVRVGAPGFVPATSPGATDGGLREVRLQRGPLRLDGVVLRADKPEPRIDLCLEGPSGQATVSAGDGRFSFEGLPPGRYQLTASPRPARTSTVQTIELRDGGASVVVNL